MVHSMVVVRASQLAAGGYLVLAEHPWKSGKLARYAKELGIEVPGDAIVLRVPPPWAKTREYLEGASDYQLQSMLGFGEVASRTAGQPLNVRLKTIAQELRGRSYGRTPKVKAPVLPKIRAMLQGGRPQMVEMSI